LRIGRLSMAKQLDTAMHVMTGPQSARPGEGRQRWRSAGLGALRKHLGGTQLALKRTIAGIRAWAPSAAVVIPANAGIQYSRDA
jgi:hypothetical protein